MLRKSAFPILLIHGDRDAQAGVEHSRRMAAALERAKKPHRAVVIKDATHQLGRKSDRIALLTELERFLRQNLDHGASGGF